MTTAQHRIERIYRTSRFSTGRVRRECWGAIVDGVWRVERDEDYGTTWSIKHLPTGTILPTTTVGGKVWRSEAGATVATVFGTLAKAVAFIESGRAADLLDRALAPA